MKNPESVSANQFEGVLFTVKGKNRLLSRTKRRRIKRMTSFLWAIPLTLKSIFSGGLSSKRKASAVLTPAAKFNYGAPAARTPFWRWLRVNFAALMLAAVMLTQFVIASPLVTPTFMDITINDNGTKQTIRTNVPTVGALLNELADDQEIVLGAGDISLWPDEKQLYHGMEIPISRGKTVTLKTMSGSQAVAMNAGTVADVLKTAEIDYQDGDIVNPPLNTLITPGMEIHFTTRSSEYVFTDNDLPYVEIVQKDYDLPKGETKVAREGQMGVRRDTFLVSFMNGEEVARDKVDSAIVQDPVNQIILEGQYVKPTPTPKPEVQKTSSSGGKTSSSGGKTSSSGSSSSSSGSSNSGTLDMDRVVKTMHMTATAYHDNLRTACGHWPKRGTIAVHKSEIPYGTKMYVPGYGFGVADDTGGFGPNTIDLYMDSERECRVWGRKKVTVYILKN